MPRNLVSALLLTVVCLAGCRSTMPNEDSPHFTMRDDMQFFDVGADDGGIRTGGKEAPSRQDPRSVLPVRTSYWDIPDEYLNMSGDERPVSRKQTADPSQNLAD